MLMAVVASGGRLHLAPTFGAEEKERERRFMRFPFFGGKPIISTSDPLLVWRLCLSAQCIDVLSIQTSSFFLPSVPPKKPTIHDQKGRRLLSKLGPYKVGDEAVVTCKTSGGKQDLRIFLTPPYLHLTRNLHYKNQTSLLHFGVPPSPSHCADICHMHMPLKREVICLRIRFIRPIHLSTLARAEKVVCLSP